MLSTVRKRCLTCIYHIYQKVLKGHWRIRCLKWSMGSQKPPHPPHVLETKARPLTWMNIFFMHEEKELNEIRRQMVTMNASLVRKGRGEVGGCTWRPFLCMSVKLPFLIAKMSRSKILILIYNFNGKEIKNSLPLITSVVSLKFPPFTRDHFTINRNTY